MRLFIAIMVINLACTSGLYFAKSDGWKPTPDSAAFSQVVGWVNVALTAWGMWVLFHG